MATAARAPPIMAAQETADCEPEFSSATTLRRPPVSATSAIVVASLMPEKHQQDNDRDRYAEQPEKNAGICRSSKLVTAQPPLSTDEPPRIAWMA